MRPGITPEPERTQLIAAAESANGAAVDLRRAVRAAHVAGGSVREIADLISRSTNTIHRWIKDGDPVGLIPALQDTSRVTLGNMEEM